MAFCEMLYNLSLQVFPNANEDKRAKAFYSYSATPYTQN